MRPKTLSTELDENSEKSQFVIAEYNALRDEIMKRSEFRYQILYDFVLRCKGSRGPGFKGSGTRMGSVFT